MKRPTVASQKKVTAENLERLGAARLAALLAAAAAARPELKRRLRMELAAEHGAEHLALEIDKRLGSLESSRSKVSWRQRPAFVRDLEGLRALIAGRMAELDRAGALARLWRLIDVAPRVGARMRDRDGELAAVFQRVAADIGALLDTVPPEAAAEALVASILHNTPGWGEWLEAVLGEERRGLAQAALGRLRDHADPTPGRMTVVRRLADAAGDIATFRATFSATALQTPAIAAEVAQRLLAAGDMAAAGELLRGAAAEAAGNARRGRRPSEGDDAWQAAWIDYLEASGDADAAQAARWAAFERSLSVEQLRTFTSRLAEFDDVDAEGRAFDHAARFADARRGLAFLMAWPALPEAARMIQARGDELAVPAEEAELWAARLRARHPAAAHLLLRKAAAAAFKRREFATSERLTAEADSIAV